MSALSLVALMGAFVSSTMAHGIVVSAVAGGVKEMGYNPAMEWENPKPAVVGWANAPNNELGFISPSRYQSSDIICHLDAQNPKKSLTVAAGETVELQWNDWDWSHRGPVLDYLAPCSNGDCSTVDKNSLKFVKIAEKGATSFDGIPGRWATDELRANGNKWTVTIPKEIKAGEYVLRHEIIALHSGNHYDGAQNYPQCINLKVTGGGNVVPQGVSATEFYNIEDPGIHFNYWEKYTSYPIPGPALWTPTKAAQNEVEPPSPTSTKAPTATSPVSSPTYVQSPNYTESPEVTHSEEPAETEDPEEPVETAPAPSPTTRPTQQSAEHPYCGKGRWRHKQNGRRHVRDFARRR